LDFQSQNGQWNGGYYMYTDISNPILDSTYHIRAFAVLSDSTTLYSPEKTFRVPSLKVQTDSISKQSSDVTLYGSFLNVGVDPIKEYGFCYSTNSSLPNVNDNKTSLSNPKNGSFFSSIPLVSGNTYYVRAYAITNNKVVYGQVKSKAF
jgi:hypothetical protein